MVGGCPHRLKLFKQVDLSFNITFRANNASIMTCVDTVQLFIHLLMAFQMVASSAFQSNFASPGALTQGPQRTVSPNSPELGPRRRYVETGGSTEIRLEALIHHRQSVISIGGVEYRKSNVMAREFPHSSRRLGFICAPEFTPKEELSSLLTFLPRSSTRSRALVRGRHRAALVADRNKLL